MARPKATVLPEPVWAETIEVAAFGIGFEDGGLDGRGRAHSRARRALRREAAEEFRMSYQVQMGRAVRLARVRG